MHCLMLLHYHTVVQVLQQLQAERSMQESQSEVAVIRTHGN